MENSQNIKARKKGGCLLGILKFFIFIGLIFLIIFGYKVYKKNKEFDKLVNDLVLMDRDSYFESKLNEPSDINGLTVREKVEQGLLAYDKSDSDGDGLTDKEEIEIYHTNPLKASSSGDDIPDGYKVLNNMDLNKKYDVEDIKDSYLFESLDNIKLKDKNAKNAYCNIREVNIKLYGNIVDKAVRIDDYIGKIEVDFSKDVGDDKEYVLFTLYDSDDTDINEIKLKNGKATINIEENGVTIGLMRKSRFNTMITDEDSSEIRGNSGIFILSPLAYMLGQKQIIIIEKTLIDYGESDRSDELTKKLSTYLDTDINVIHRYSKGLEFEILKKILGYMMTPQYFKDISQRMDSEMDDDKAQEASKMIRLFITYGELDSGKWMSLLKIEEDISEGEEVKKEKPSKYVSTFTRKDIFPFPNLSTYISPGGNCAGIAEITTQVFNGVFFEKEDFGHFMDNDYAYSIKDEEMNTLFDKYLDDYKYNNYWKDTYENLLDKSIISEKDQEFIDLIGFKWARANELYDNELRMWEVTYDWSEMQDLLNYFENGDRICTVFLHGNIVHAINAYGIEQDKDDEDVYRILIYDNNFPDGKWGDNIIDEYITVRKITKKNWKGEKIEKYKYEYAPLKKYKKGKFYTVTNKLHFYDNGNTLQKVLGTALQCQGMDFFDENGELINKSRINE